MHAKIIRQKDMKYYSKNGGSRYAESMDCGFSRTDRYSDQ